MRHAKLAASDAPSRPMPLQPFPSLSPKAAFVLSVALLAGAVAFAFRGAPFLGFVDYDDPLVVLDPRLRGGLTPEALRFAFTGTAANLWLPLTSLSHALDHEIYGEWAGGHHLTNVAIHFASSLVLLCWLRRHTGRTVPALAAALLFAIHPLRVESVVWVTERKDVLSLLFYLLSVSFYSSWAAAGGKGRAPYLLAVLAAALGVLSKPSLMTLPAVLLLVDVWPLRRLRWEDRLDPALLRKRLVEKAPFFLLALAAAAIAWSTWSEGQLIGVAVDLPLLRRIGFASAAYVSYLQRTVVPIDLIAFQPYPLGLSPMAMAGSFAALALATFLACRRLREAPWIAVGWLWFLGTILPGSGLVTISDHFAPDRYAYLAHVGLFAALAFETDRHLGGNRSRVAAGLALAAVLAALAVLTDRQTRKWKDSETLWRHALAAGGPNYVAHNQLGLLYLSQGRREEGVAELRAAIAANPEFPVAASNLSRAMAAKGDFAEAARLLRENGATLPQNRAYRQELLQASLAAGDRATAAGLWRDLVAEEPDDLRRRLGAAAFFYEIGDEEESLGHYHAAARIDPGNHESMVSIGALLLKRGAVADSLPWLERALATAKTAEAASRSHRALAQANVLGRSWEQALAHYGQALEFDSDDLLLINEFAQLLLDCPEPAHRDPKQARELAERLDDGVDSPNPRHLRTLARARLASGAKEPAREAALAGLAAVEAIAAKDPLEKPWTEQEMASLRRSFERILEQFSGDFPEKQEK